MKNIFLNKSSTILPDSADISISVRTIMLHVIIALLPGIIFWIYIGGPQTIALILAAITSAIIVESLCLKIRGYNVLDGLGDLSAIVTAVLLVLCLPSQIPILYAAIGVGFALIFGKHVYGGLGHNLFNPAMVGYAVLLISFPTAMAALQLEQHAVSWQWPWFIDSISHNKEFIVYSGPTPMDQYNVAIRTQSELNEGLNISYSKAYYLMIFSWCIGGFYLIARGFSDWRLPMSVLLGVFITLGLDGLITSISQSSEPSLISMPFIAHLVASSTFFGAFFIATDPVTAPSKRKARWIYGFCIGVLLILLRKYSAYPDGFAFAILLMNAAAPFLDQVVSNKK